MPHSVLDVFEHAQSLLAVSPEELGAVMLEITHTISPQSQHFTLWNFLNPLEAHSNSSWPHALKERAGQAIAEAFQWLENSGLIMSDPSQPHGTTYRIRTRLGSKLRDRSLVAEYQRSAILPTGLVHPEILEKSHAAFIRGDHDVAVLAAFKAVEVAVREACGYQNGEIGIPLMRRAFNRDNGPLSDPEQEAGERQSLQDLFAGAIGAAKNPASHRDVELSKVEAARLILFASYLMSVVEMRKRS